MADSWLILGEASARPGLLLALLLAAAIGGGHAARFFKLPQVVGYVLGGLALRYAVLAVSQGAEGAEAAASHSEQSPTLWLRGVKDLALGLILFSIGGVFERDHFRRVGSQALKTSLCEIGMVVGAVGVACGAAYLLSTNLPLDTVLSCSVLLGIIAIEAAPAGTVVVLREYDAKGPATDMLLTLTALNNLTALILFPVALLLLNVLELLGEPSPSGNPLWLDLTCATAGTVVVAMVIGFFLSIAYAKLEHKEFLVLFLGCLLGFGHLSAWFAESFGLTLNPLLSWLVAGAVFHNITMDKEPLARASATVGGPVFAAFFALAGYELHVGDLLHFGVVGICYAGARLLAKWLGVRLGARWAGKTDAIPGYLGLGLICQAGIAIGLVDLLTREWVVEQGGRLVADPRAENLKTIVLGAVVFFELCGPVVLKRVLVRTGEVKAISLLRRPFATTSEGDSVWVLAWQALMRTVGLWGAGARKAARPLQVRDIMRSNVEVLESRADLDEVLRFVERSRYNHFPVVDEERRFVGMIQFSDLREMMYDPSMRDLITAIDLADQSAPAAPIDLPVDELAALFGKTDMASLAVVDSAGGRHVVGLVEQRDLLRALRNQTRQNQDKQVAQAPPVSQYGSNFAGSQRMTIQGGSDEI